MRMGDGSFQKVKAGAIALGNFTALTAASGEWFARASVGAPRCRRQGRCAGRAWDDAIDAGGCERSPGHRRDQRLLLARGADVNAKSLAGETALDWAVKIGTKPAIDVLRRAGGIGNRRTRLSRFRPRRLRTCRLPSNAGGCCSPERRAVAAANGGVLPATRTTSSTRSSTPG